MTQWKMPNIPGPPHTPLCRLLCRRTFPLKTSSVLSALVQDLPDWQEILTYFRGSELQNYFTRILEDDLKAIIKPQYVDHIPKVNTAHRGSCMLANCRQKQLCSSSGLLASNRMHQGLAPGQ